MKTKSSYFQVLDYVHDNPGCSTTDIAQALGMEYYSVKRILDDEYHELRLAKASGHDLTSNTSTWRWYLSGI